MFLKDNVDEKINCRVEHDQGVRDVVHDQQPPRPVGQDLGLPAVDGLVHGRDQLPDVTEEEDPDDRHRDPGQTVLGLVVLIVRSLSVPDEIGSASESVRTSEAADLILQSSERSG